MFTADRLVEVIKKRCDGRCEPVLVFWCQIATNRDELCRQIEELRGEDNIIPLVPRGLGFDNPNALLADLNRLISEHREQFVAVGSRATSNDRPLALLLLSRTEFALPQIASLTVLPHWFPRVGGESVYITIEDLTRTADGPMNVQEAHVSDLCERLFKLDVSLVRRLTGVVRRDHKLGNAFFTYVRRGEENFTGFLEGAQTYLGEIRNPQGYRPSVRDGRSLVGRLLNLMQTTTPDQIDQRAKALAKALDISEGRLPVVNDSIVAVILRPVNRDTSPSVRFARNIIATTYSSAQFITAAAHADDYPSYPILLLRSLSYNLRTTLDDLTQVLVRLDNTSDTPP
ncbi:MAG TPA: hypothetical protein VFZ44_04060 [Pyrinomonadaceae bacterium]